MIGEGGSGGALALALADHVLMLEHGLFGRVARSGAAILLGDASKAEEAAARLRLTSEDLRRFGIVDEVIPEPLGGAHRDRDVTIDRVLTAVDRHLGELGARSTEQLQEERYGKYRRVGALNTNRMAFVAPSETEGQQR